MGLMYIMPVSEKEIDRVEITGTANGKSITLKSYGLPYIFWGYLAAVIAVLLAMGLAMKAPLLKMLTMSNPLDLILARVVLATFLAIPLTLVALLFYEKFITKEGNKLTITHRFFWLPVKKKTFDLKPGQNLFVDHFLDSPNMAKRENNKDYRAFQNHGYYKLQALLENEKMIFIDRHSRKADLTKMCEVLSRY